MYIDTNIICGKDTLFFLNNQRKMMFYTPKVHIKSV